MKVITALCLLCALMMMLCMNVEQVYQADTNISTAKNEAAATIHDGGYTCILSISDQEFASGKVSYRDESEISYYGKLYDIVNLTKMDGKVLIKALHDEKEEGLLADVSEVIERWFDNPAKSPSRHNSSTQVLILKDFIPAAKFTFCGGNNETLAFAMVSARLSLAPIISVIKSPPQAVNALS